MKISCRKQPPEVFGKKNIKTFANFIEKHVLKPLFDTVAGLTLFKKESPIQMFICEIYEKSKNNYFVNDIYERLLLRAPKKLVHYKN